MKMKKIKVEYFAKLREERKLSQEKVETYAETAREFYNELRQKHNFSFPTEHLKIAINEKFQPWDSVLNDSDTVVFIPPVAGG